MKNVIFWDVTTCGPCKDRRFGGTCRLHHQLLITAKVPSSLILFTVMMNAISSYETSVLTGATRRNIPEEDILQNKEWCLLGCYAVWLS
jgi:hypothetical protein